MVKVERKVELLLKYNPSVFEKINNEALGEAFRKIGSSVSGVSKMVTGINAEMLRLLMPEILKTNPDTKNQNWESLVSDYWNSLSVMIPTGGKVLETGFNFSISDFTRKDYIKELSVKTDQELADYVMGYKGEIPNIPEDERFRYGHPIDVESYLLWRYCQYYGRVANDIKDINKSPKISFYLHSKEERERIIKEQRKFKKQSIDAYVEFISKAKIDDYDDVLSLLTPESVKDIVSNKDLEDKQAKVMEFATNQPNKFLDAIKDKNRQVKATIERYLTFGILKKLPNSTIIVDASDSSVVVGNNVDEAVAFFSNDKNNNKLKEFIAKYKSIIA